MEIPNPKAQLNEEILVSNYRAGGKWQKGKITTLEYKNSYDSWSWKYDVLVVGRNGSYYRIYVGDDAIRSLKKDVAIQGLEVTGGEK